MLELLGRQRSDPIYVEKHKHYRGYNGEITCSNIIMADTMFVVMSSKIYMFLLCGALKHGAAYVQ